MDILMILAVCAIIATLINGNCKNSPSSHLLMDSMAWFFFPEIQLNHFFQLLGVTSSFDIDLLGGLFIARVYNFRFQGNVSVF